MEFYYFILKFILFFILKLVSKPNSAYFKMPVQSSSKYSLNRCAMRRFLVLIISSSHFCSISQSYFGCIKSNLVSLQFGDLHKLYCFLFFLTGTLNHLNEICCIYPRCMSPKITPRSKTILLHLAHDSILLLSVTTRIIFYHGNTNIVDNTTQECGIRLSHPEVGCVALRRVM